mmetsp:Transcript_3247/g.11333  ORF Transcript_3247/g.11333 Transcript_3247/m.11333 type:complete len:402 (+) Transcript_3247:952-2157(+)
MKPASSTRCVSSSVPAVTLEKKRSACRSTSGFSCTSSERNLARRALLLLVESQKFASVPPRPRSSSARRGVASSRASVTRATYCARRTSPTSARRSTSSAQQASSTSRMPRMAEPPLPTACTALMSWRVNASGKVCRERPLFGRSIATSERRAGRRISWRCSWRMKSVRHVSSDRGGSVMCRSASHTVFTACRETVAGWRILSASSMSSASSAVLPSFTSCSQFAQNASLAQLSTSVPSAPVLWRSCVTPLRSIEAMPDVSTAGAEPVMLSTWPHAASVAALNLLTSSQASVSSSGRRAGRFGQAAGVAEGMANASAEVPNEEGMEDTWKAGAAAAWIAAAAWFFFFFITVLPAPMVASDCEKRSHGEKNTSGVRKRIPAALANLRSLSPRSPGLPAMSPT